MKKLKWVFGTLLLALVPVLAWAGLAQAQHFATTVENDQTIHSSVYSAGKEANIKGTIYGDVFCMGQKVTVDATVYGDVICAGGEVTVSGKVEGNVRLAGQRVTLSGEVSKNATVAGMNVSLDAHAKVGQDLTVNGQELNIKGSVGRDVVASGNTVILNGTVARNVKANSANVQLKDGARIAGGLYYTSQQDAKVDPSAQVLGKTERIAEQKQGGFNVMLYLFAVVSLTLIGVLLAYLFPRFFKKTNETISANIPKTMVIGLLGVVLIIATCVGLLLTLVGIPLAIALLIAGIAGAVLSGPISAYYLGSLVLRKAKNASPATIALVGGPILVTLYYLPLVGLLALVAAWWLGFGALLLSLRPYMRHPQTVSTSAGKKKK